MNAVHIKIVLNNIKDSPDSICTDCRFKKNRTCYVWYRHTGEKEIFNVINDQKHPMYLKYEEILSEGRCSYKRTMGGQEDDRVIKSYLNSIEKVMYV